MVNGVWINGAVNCCFFPVFNFLISQGYPAGNSQRSTFSLATQLLLCQQPLLVPGLLLHCLVVYYFVLAATPTHPSARGPALHPLFCAVVGSRSPLTHNPHQPLNFVQQQVQMTFIQRFALWGRPSFTLRTILAHTTKETVSFRTKTKHAMPSQATASCKIKT